MSVTTLSYLINQCINRNLTEAESKRLESWLLATAIFHTKNTI